MDPGAGLSISRVLSAPELRHLILSYLDPASVKEAALVSRYVELCRNVFD